MWLAIMDATASKGLARLSAGMVQESRFAAERSGGLPARRRASDLDVEVRRSYMQEVAQT